MAVYLDFSAYTYSVTDLEMFNVGWLGGESKFATGKILASAWDELLRRVSAPENIMRGLHDCELCNIESPIRIASQFSDRGFVSLGTGEIHVKAGDGQVMGR